MGSSNVCKGLICDIGRAVFAVLNNVAVIPALAKVNRLSIEMRSEAPASSRENIAAGKHSRQSLPQNALYGCEHMVFNPWNCLPEHMPLGSVNRMRLGVYLASRQVRRKLNMVGHEQPAEARSFGRTSADEGAAECRE